MKCQTILLIYPQPAVKKEWRFGFSLNLLYIAAILKEAGYEVSYVDYSTEPYCEEDFICLCQKASAVIIEFDAFPLKRSLNIMHGDVLLRLLREHSPQTRIIAIGYDCLLTKQIVPLADYTFTTEWEGNIVQILNTLLQNGSVNGFPVQAIQNLDDLPFPDRKILSERVERGGDVYRAPHLARSTLIQTSRGCQNTCRFCQRHGWARYFRSHSIEYSLAEFQAIHREGYVNVWITDDNFTFNLNRAKILLRRIIKEVKKRPWKIALSSWTHIDREVIELCYEAGVSIISFGIESANKDILNFYRKQIDIDHLNTLITYADEIGIFCVGNFIIGAPMESMMTIQQSIDFAKSIPLDQINVKILDYMIGSQLYEVLPAKLKNERHIFASKEHGLCDFSLTDLKNIAYSFSTEVSKYHQDRVNRKMLRCGLPYIVQPNQDKESTRTK